MIVGLIIAFLIGGCAGAVCMGLVSAAGDKSQWRSIADITPMYGQKVILKKEPNEVTIARFIFWEKLNTEEWLINGMTYKAIEPSDKWMPIP